MYEIRPETVKTFITDRNIKLPRFQRKQTWDEKKNFQLCISLFKEYPIGVCILSVDSNKGKTVRWLLDGRQRKNALKLIYEDPENIYNWAKKFIGFKNSDQPSDIEEQFWKKIYEYIEFDQSEEENSEEENSGEENSGEENDPDEYEEEIEESKSGLDLLLDIIKIIHNKKANNTGFTKPFDFTKYVERLPYVDNVNGKTKISSKKLKTFLDEYRRHCDIEGIEYNEYKSMIEFINLRCTVKDKTRLNNYVKQNWKSMNDRLVIIDKIDSVLSNSKIGMIEVKDLSPSDSQKIFNIINSEGEKLTAVEILSAKPNWNIKVEHIGEEARDTVRELYKKIGTNYIEDVVRWDLPATLMRRLKKNIIFKQFTESKSDFEKEITLGFKILAGLYQEGVKKEDIENLSKKKSINWSSDIENIIFDLNQMIKLIESTEYFKYFKSWRISIMDLTSDAIAINFLIVMYKDWARKDKPIGNDIRTKQFQKNAFILLDRLIYEYVNRLWRGSSDSRISNNINALDKEDDIFRYIETSRWKEMLNEIYNYSTIDGNDISLNLMKPILYHFYCIKNIQGPDTNYSIEVDHIIPQNLFKQSAIERREVLKDNILNLGLLPKDDNISKSNKRLIEINSPWLKDQIKKYEFIEETDYTKYSDLNNYSDIFKSRQELFNDVFDSLRSKLINN